MCFQPDSNKVRRLVKQVVDKHGRIGFEYQLNGRATAKKRSMSATDPVPKKKQKLSGSGSECKDTNIPMVRTRAQAVLGESWRWSPARRAVAVQQAVSCKLFDMKVTDGKRDSKIADIVHDINQMTHIDVNFVLLTKEQYTKEIYKIQRKVIRIGVNDKSQIALLPMEEQELFKQLDASGHVKEASKAKMSANSSSVIFSVSINRVVLQLISNIYLTTLESL